MRYQRARKNLIGAQLEKERLNHKLSQAKENLTGISLQLASKNDTLRTIQKDLKNNKSSFEGESRKIINTILSNVIHKYSKTIMARV